MGKGLVGQNWGEFESETKSLSIAYTGFGSQDIVAIINTQCHTRTRKKDSRCALSALLSWFISLSRAQSLKLRKEIARE